MCATSVIYDMFRPLPDEWYTLERIDLFKNMIQTAKTFDVESGQPDCEDPEKSKLEARIFELESNLK